MCLIDVDVLIPMRNDMEKIVNHVGKLIMEQPLLMQRVQQVSACCEICGYGHTGVQCLLNPKSIYSLRKQSRRPMNQNAQYGIHTIQIGGITLTFNRGNQHNNRPQGRYQEQQKSSQQAQESLIGLLKKLLANNQQIRLENQQLRIDFQNLERKVKKIVSNLKTRLAELFLVTLRRILRLQLIQ